ncbi:mycothiol transferase [Streptomyces asiaticus]|uniref:mycothiol transferase n=1 Tax=Streptomyces asiaticus TaxID=114695 RepID=UPI003824EF20
MNGEQRIHPSKAADDRASLTPFLDYQRATLAMKCQGLTGEQLEQKAIPTSELTLLGLVRHAASIERSSFRFALGAEDVRSLWPGEVDGTFAEFHVEDCPCRKPHPCRSSSMPVLVEDAAEAIVSTYVEVG